MKFSYCTTQGEAGSSHTEYSEYQIWIILRGCVLLTDGKEEIEAEAGDVIEIPGGREITLRSDNGFTAGCIILSDFLVTRNKLRKHPAHTTKLLQKAFLFALDIQELEHPHKQAVMSLVDHIVWEGIGQLATDVEELPPAIVALTEKIQKEGLSIDFDLTEAMRDTGFSEAYTRRLFMDAVGVTPVAFLNIWRIEAAKKMIREDKTASSFRQIAERCGFSDPYYFSNVFKKQTGKSPREYKKSVQDDQS